MTNQIKKIWKVALFVLLWLEIGITCTHEKVTGFSTIELAPGNHNPIILIGDQAVDEFCTNNGTDGLSWATAYVIQNLQINANQSGSGIEICNTSRYIRIENVSCSFSGYSDVAPTADIYVDGCQHVNISRCLVWASHFGVYLKNCIGVDVDSSILISCQTGLEANNCSCINLHDNQVFHSTIAVILSSVSNSKILQLTIEDTQEGLGLSWTTNSAFFNISIKQYNVYGINLDYSNNNRFNNLQFSNPNGQYNIITYKSTQNDFGNYHGFILYYSIEVTNFLPTIVIAACIIGGIIVAWIFIIKVRNKKALNVQSSAGIVKEKRKMKNND